MSEKPYYGSLGVHIWLNFIVGIVLLVLGLIAGLTYHFLGFIFCIFSIYFFWMAYGWSKGGRLEEKLRIREEFLRIVGVEDGERILDVGTGAGLIAIGFAKAMKGGEVVGIDVWVPGGGGTSLKNALSNAKIEGVADKVEFKYGDACSIPFPDNYFDKVVASFVIHIIRQPKRIEALKEMVRVLKPNGTFAILEPPKGFGGWKVDDRLKIKLEDLGLENIKYYPFILNYPRKRRVFLIMGTKRSANKGNRDVK